MEKAKKIKLFIGLSYLILLSIFLILFFSKFSLQEITSYNFIKENRSYLLGLKDSNLFLVSIIFLIFTILWVFPLLGFGSPIALMGGFIFGKWIGTIVVVLGLSVGATFLYIFGNFFLKDFIREKFLNKYKNSDFLNFCSRFTNLFKNFSLTKSFKKKFPKIYKNVAPILNPKTTIVKPNHLPKIKPPSKAMGDPKPKKGNTHKIVNSKKDKDNNNKFDFFIFEKYSMLSLINSYENNCCKLNFENK